MSAVMSTRHGPPEPWQGLAVPISEDRWVVSVEGAQLLVHLLGVLERVAARDGGRLSPAALEMRDVFASSPRSSSGHGDMCDEVDEAVSAGELIGTAEAGVVLGVTRRHASRLADEGVLGPVERAGGRTLVYRSEVIAYNQERGKSR